MQDRVPPANIKSEMEVLGAMLQVEGGIEALETARAILKPGDLRCQADYCNDT